ncbi:type III PLP-dependent enzyme [Marinomonas spartinae]|uniref:type III PLP-dependent enzyme n=1 Tax=Marinomonas spartinae TaxID=1792290 RepID=UPI0018F23898|nr:type III PLP-dependent enzyme [Marinomonas spartinae]MBJ7553988.1 type III PLP-dependent enzyme [Marinomonas spartinae]
MTSYSISSNLESHIHRLATQQPDDPLCAYLYDLGSLSTRIQEMVATLPPNVSLFYAAKANPMPEILTTLAPFVAGFEAASGGELMHLAQQNTHKPLIFGGPGKLNSELKTALEHNVDAIHVESITELKRLEALANALDLVAPVYLRMNIDIGDITLSKLAMGGKPTPFGLDEEDLNDALTLIKRTDRIRLNGFHFHLMSHQLETERHIALIQGYFNKVKQWQAVYQLDAMGINLGGGMGINYLEPGKDFDWPTFCQQLQHLIVHEGMESIPLRFECGRFISAPCGYYAMEVIDIKKNLGEYFAICRGGTHHFRTPAAQGHDHPFIVVPHQKATDSTHAEHAINNSLVNERISIVGQLCTPKDILARQQLVQELKIGDYVVFTLAGAYAWNISHQAFLMHPEPSFYFFNHPSP